jgi:nicotinamide mononucleotide (NMN) deamidase PncC
LNFKNIQKAGQAASARKVTRAVAKAAQTALICARLEIPGSSEVFKGSCGDSIELKQKLLGVKAVLFQNSARVRGKRI